LPVTGLVAGNFFSEDKLPRLIDLVSLTPLFRPQSVAIVGASSDPLKIGGRPVDYLKQYDFQGAIYPINPKAEVIQDLPAFANIKDIAGIVDLVICAVPGPLVPQVMQDCADKGVKAIVMFSSGFAEVSGEGAAQQQQLAALAASAGIRLMGPNCMGVANFADGMIASFHPGYAIPSSGRRNISLVSQSGAFGGLSAMIYLEGCRNGAKLIEALSLARHNRKKVVAIKLGRTDAGAEAAGSHTAALAGSDAIYDAIFNQYGVYRANNIEEFYDVACAASHGLLPENNRVGLITVSGGVGVLMADDASARGLDVAPLPDATQMKFKELVPFAGVRNPLDVTGQVMNDRTLFEQGIRLVLDEGDYGGIVCFQGAGAKRLEVKEETLATWQTIRDAYPDRMIALAGQYHPATAQALEAMGFPVAAEPTHATRAIAALHDLFQARQRITPLFDIPADPPALPSGPISEVEAMNILYEAGIPAVDEYLVTSADEAAAAAIQIKQPVVMKVVSRQITHKSDVGGVRLNVDGGSEARRAFEKIIDSVRLHAPDAEIEGCLIAPMAGDGVETIIGVTHDPTFGPVVMFGLGGIFVEVLEDVTFRLAPIDVAEAERMIREIKAFKILEGVRGYPPADIESLAEAIAALSVFAASYGDQIESVEANPFLVKSIGEGAAALDAVLIMREKL
jgi:acyl-CoA synthetase (NDP forming)